MFKPGQSGNPNGRPKGSPNRINREIKDVVNRILENLDDPRIDKIMIDIMEEKPEAVLSFLGKVAPKDISINKSKEPNRLIEELKLIREPNAVQSETDRDS